MFTLDTTQLQAPLTTATSLWFGVLVAIAATLHEVTAYLRHKNYTRKAEEEKAEATRQAKRELDEQTRVMRQDLLTNRQSAAESTKAIELQVDGRMADLLANLDKYRTQFTKITLENRVLKEKIVDIVIQKTKKKKI